MLGRNHRGCIFIALMFPAWILSSLGTITLVRAQGMDLTRINVLYSNVRIVSVEDTSTHVSFSLTGSQMQVAWLLLDSPWKPLQVTSNNTLQPFSELSYEPANMSENPIANTSEQFAWDYDSINKVVFAKLLLTSTSSPVAVKITLYYVVLARFSDFSLDKLNYSITDPIDAYATVSANYTLDVTFNWLVKILIFDSPNGTLFQEGSESFDLRANETKTVHYQFLPITVLGNYTAVARIIDPRNDNVVVASSQIAFEVSGSETPPQEGMVFPDWLKILLVALVLTLIGVLAYRKLRNRVHITKLWTKLRSSSCL